MKWCKLCRKPHPEDPLQRVWPGKAAPAADAKPTSVPFAKRPTLAKGPHEPLDEASIPF